MQPLKPGRIRRLQAFGGRNTAREMDFGQDFQPLRCFDLLTMTTLRRSKTPTIFGSTIAIPARALKELIAYQLDGGLIYSYLHLIIEE